MKKLEFNFAVINLGCTKNLVDTQHFLGHLLTKKVNKSVKINYFIDSQDINVEYVFLNTCGFISTGREEMFLEINKLLKKNKYIYVFGCAVYYLKKLIKNYNLSEYQNKKIFFLSRKDLFKLDINEIISGYQSTSYPVYQFPSSPRAYTNIDQGYEYLKIAEGCNNKCSYCIIPKLRGKFKSVPIDQIINEIANMHQMGISEIIFLAQDTSRYGIDLIKKTSLFDLLIKIENLSIQVKYRLLYLYPDNLTINQISKFLDFSKFIPYFDLPLQHINPLVLKNMKRFADAKKIKNLLNFIKKKFTQSFIRTNIIVGFPGETDEQFQELVHFLQEYDFDNIALFEYHDEILADSYRLPDKKPVEIIRARFLILQKIVNQKLALKLKIRKGSIQEGMITDFVGTSKLKIRPYLHAPEIDPVDIIKINQINESNTEFKIGMKIKYKL